MDADMQAAEMPADPVADAQAAHNAHIVECAKGIDAVGGKVAWLYAVRLNDIPGLQARDQAGDRMATALLNAADAMAAHVAAAKPGAGPHCLGCGRPAAERPYSVAVASAGVPDSPLLFGPVCTTCAIEPQAVRVAALPTFRNIWPGMKLLPMVDAVGRA